MFRGGPKRHEPTEVRWRANALEIMFAAKGATASAVYQSTKDGLLRANAVSIVELAQPSARMAAQQGSRNSPYATIHGQPGMDHFAKHLVDSDASLSWCR